jgi:signal transduction histidine kinase
VRISDNGPGMKEELLKKIFEPFFTTKDPGKGTGLGLFIVKQIIEKNNGVIKVASELGKGTVFSVIFPFAEGI